MIKKAKNRVKNSIKYIALGTTCCGVIMASWFITFLRQESEATQKQRPIDF